MPIPRLTTLPRPFIVCVLTERSVAAAVATMRLAVPDGAHAFELNLPAVGDFAPGDLFTILRATDRPVYTSCRRAAFMAVYGMDPAALPAWSEEERMARQVAAVKAGAVALDMEMDTFDPRPAPTLGSDAAAAFAATDGPPAEFSTDHAALARQAEVMAAVHAAGGEVILSCHTGRPQSQAQLVAICRAAVERGGDLVKVVSPCAAPADLWAMQAAMVQLRSELPVPFILVGAGPWGQLSRHVGVHLGCGWALCQQTYTPGGFHGQPLVAHQREIMRLMPWRLPE